MGKNCGFSWPSHTPCLWFCIPSRWILRHQISLWLWSCTRRGVCPGVHLLCTSSMQFPDRSRGRWGHHRFYKYNHKIVSRPSSMFNEVFARFILLIYPWQRASTTGLVMSGYGLSAFLDYLPYILRRERITTPTPPLIGYLHYDNMFLLRSSSPTTRRAKPWSLFRNKLFSLWTAWQHWQPYSFVKSWSP